MFLFCISTIFIEIVFFVVTGCMKIERSLPTVDYFVATNGNDNWTGTLANAVDSGTDGPFATIERARNEIRKRRKNEQLPSKGFNVYIRGGIYELQQSIEMYPEDSGTRDAPITYGAYGSETVRFVGGKQISQWSRVTDSDILSRLNPKVRNVVLQADIRVVGIANFGRVAGVSSVAQLVYNSKYMQLARYPNTGDWLHIKSCYVPV